MPHLQLRYTLGATLLALWVLSTSKTCTGCMIAGTDSGVCSEDTLDASMRAVLMPFCANRIKYKACVPKPQGLPPDRR